jgi:uncharacterized protein (TIGR02646 family)
MKKLYKSPSPNELTNYAANYPTDRWDDFCTHAAEDQHPGDDYRAIKRRLIDDQGGLCGYCEQQVGDRDSSLQRIEHYHPKSDTSDPAVNWALMWSNVILVCTGGEKDGESYPLPGNLSCDAHKNRVFGNAPPQAVGAALADQITPFTMPAFPCLFCLDMGKGELLPSLDACETIDRAQSLPIGSTHRDLTATVEALNLNCDRLCQDRLKVRNEYNRRVKEARMANDTTYREKMAHRWFSNRWPIFFTTRRILLGSAAEDYLRQIHFAG